MEEELISCTSAVNRIIGHSHGLDNNIDFAELLQAQIALNDETI